jgi:hypothetical protein
MNTVKMWEMKDGDSREESPFHVKMIFGTRHVVIVDTKCKPLSRSMKIDVETITEASYFQIFSEVVAALAQSGNIADRILQSELGNAKIARAHLPGTVSLKVSRCEARRSEGLQYLFNSLPWFE